MRHDLSDPRQYLGACDIYLAKPAGIWRPTTTNLTTFEISKNLGGVSPINSLETLTP